MKKLLASFLAAAMVASTAAALAVPAFAASNFKFGDIVDGDGDPAIFNNDTVRPGDTYYIIIGKSSDYDNLLKKDWFSFSLKKRDGGKYITGTELREKRIDGTRYVVIAFDAKDNFTDDENKVKMEANFKAKKDLWIQNPVDVESGKAFPIFVDSESALTRDALPSLQQAKTDYDNAQKKLSDAKTALSALKTAVQNAARAAGLSEPSKDTNGKYATNASDAATLESDITAAEARLNALSDAIRAKNSEIQNLENAIAAQGTTKPDEEVREELVAAQTAADAKMKAAQALLTALGSNAEGTAALPGGLWADLNALTDGSDSTARANWNSKVGAFTSTAANTTNATTLEIDLANSLLNARVGTDSGEVGTAKAAFANFVTSLVTKYNTAKEDYDQAVTGLNNLAAPAANRSLSNEAQLEIAKGELKKLTDEQTAKKAVADKKPLLTAYRTAITNYNTGVDTLDTAQSDFDSAKSIYDKVLKSDPSLIKLAKGKTYTSDFTVWIQNEKLEDEDAYFTAGEKGVVIRPVKNEENIITWENSNDTIARLIFQADSDTEYICPRLSTKWSNADYLDYFDGQDAYLFDFVSNPDVPASTRATLELYNPFYDSDDDYYHNVRDLYLYQVVDGRLKEITNFDAKENDEGYDVISLRTRTLGTYIVCEEPVDLDDDGYEKPSDSNKPDIIIDANQKPIPNTGR